LLGLPRLRETSAAGPRKR